MEPIRKLENIVHASSSADSRARPSVHAASLQACIGKMQEVPACRSVDDNMQIHEERLMDRAFASLNLSGFFTQLQPSGSWVFCGTHHHKAHHNCTAIVLQTSPMPCLDLAGSDTLCRLWCLLIEGLRGMAETGWLHPTNQDLPRAAGAGLWPANVFIN